jgi:hypothetical protein
MATPTIIVPGAGGGGEVSKTLIWAWYSSNTALSGTDYLIKPNTVSSTDTDGVYSTSTGVFTIKVAGRYFIGAAIRTTTNNIDQGRDFIYASVVTAAYGNFAPYQMASGNDSFWQGTFHFTLSDVFDLAVNDTVTFFITNYGTGAPTVVAGPGSSYLKLAKIG